MDKRWSALLLTVALLVGAAPAQSATVPLTFSLDYQVAGAAPTHWLTATIKDIGEGQVKLIMDADRVPGMNDLKVTGWYFNVSDESLLGDLTFDHKKGTQAAMLIGQHPDAFGGRGFDVFFGFPSRIGNPFSENERSVYIIRGEGLSAEMFDLRNRDDLGRYFSMATVSGPGLGRASLAAVPIPSAVWMLGAGLVGLVAIRRSNR